MLVKKLFRLYQNAEGGGEGSGGGGSGTGGSGGADDLDAKIKAASEKAVAEATAGLSTKNKELLAELKQERDKYKGIDPERARQLLSKFESDEDADLIAKGKIDEFLSKKYAKRDADWQQKLKEAEDKIAAAEGKAKKFLDRVLDDRLREAFNGKVDPRSMKAALLEAKLLFTLDDEGLAVQIDSDGKVVLGKDGKTPFSPQEWVDSEAVRKESPYLFPATATGTGTGQTTTGGQTRLDVSKMTPAQKMEAGRQTKT